MLRFKDYTWLIESINSGNNVNLWGKEGVGKTFTIKNCLLKDIKLEAAYLDLDYPFNVGNIFQAIPMSFNLYYQLPWYNIVTQLSGINRLLVIDTFDRLQCVSEDFEEDLFQLQQLAKLDNFYESFNISNAFEILPVV
jgi:hypothetical protein